MVIENPERFFLCAPVPVIKRNKKGQKWRWYFFLTHDGRQGEGGLYQVGRLDFGALVEVGQGQERFNKSARMQK